MYRRDRLERQMALIAAHLDQRRNRQTKIAGLCGRAVRQFDVSSARSKGGRFNPVLFAIFPGADATHITFIARQIPAGKDNQAPATVIHAKFVDRGGFNVFAQFVGQLFLLGVVNMGLIILGRSVIRQQCQSGDDIFTPRQYLRTIGDAPVLIDQARAQIVQQRVGTPARDGGVVPVDHPAKGRYHQGKGNDQRAGQQQYQFVPDGKLQRHQKIGASLSTLSRVTITDSMVTSFFVSLPPRNNFTAAAAPSLPAVGKVKLADSSPARIAARASSM